MKKPDNKKQTDDSLMWKASTIGLLKEIAEFNEGMGIFKIPINLFKNILAQVAERAIEIDDVELNKLMLRLDLYENRGENGMPDFSYLEIVDETPADSIYKAAPDLAEALNEIVTWASVKNGKMNFSTSEEQFNQFKQALVKAGYTE